MKSKLTHFHFYETFISDLTWSHEFTNMGRNRKRRRNEPSDEQGLADNRKILNDLFKVYREPSRPRPIPTVGLTNHDTKTWSRKPTITEKPPPQAAWASYKPSKWQADKNKPCYLLELPAELRITIYELVLLEKDSVDVVFTTKEGTNFEDPPLMR